MASCFLTHVELDDVPSPQGQDCDVEELTYQEWRRMAAQEREEIEKAKALLLELEKLGASSVQRAYDEVQAVVATKWKVSTQPDRFAVLPPSGMREMYMRVRKPRTCPYAWKGLTGLEERFSEH